MSTPPCQFSEVPDRLFSEGTRSDCKPCRHPESHFEFLDRIRQPYFERERRWYEDAFAFYPEGNDRGDLRARFRSSDDFHHEAAAWELYVHELWRRLGWQLTPHPETPDGRRRDFLGKRGNARIILECAVDNASRKQAGDEKRWQEVYEPFSSLRCPNHGVTVHRDSIGSDSLRVGPLVAEAQRGLDALAMGRHGTILRVATDDGWRFRIEAKPGPLAGYVMSAFGGGMSMEERLYNPIRNRIREKSKRSSRLDLPFVLALQIVNPMPIVSEAGAVRNALMGTNALVVGRDSATSGLRPNNDGLWVRGGKPKGAGLSAVLINQGIFLGRSLPVLHHHPLPLHDLPAQDLPFEQVHYDLADSDVEHHMEARSGWHDVFGLTPEWPGPDDPFEGINTDAKMPVPGFWSPSTEHDRHR